MPQANDIESLFNKAFHIVKLYPGEDALKYAIARLRGINLHQDNWDSFQRLLTLCITPEPATLPLAMELIVKWVNAGYTSLIPEINEVINSLIIQHAPLSHSSEVSYALWACITLRINLTADAVSALSKANDSVIALLVLDCESRGLMTKNLTKPDGNSV